MAKRRGLGRGLGALIPTAPTGDEDAVPDDVSRETSEEVLAPVAGVQLREIPLEKITPNPQQPRSVFDEEALDELVASVQQVGVLQPVVLRPAENDTYQLVMGERRFRASRQAGLSSIPAVIRETPDTQLLRDALLENLHRSDLNPLEEAAAYQQLLEEFGVSHAELAERIGRSRSVITNTLRLMNLSGRVQKRVAAGVLSAGHARALLALNDPELQEYLANRVVAEGLSVRSTEELVTEYTLEGARPKRTRTRSVPRESPEAEALAEKLADHLDTRVSVRSGKRKGRIVIEFAATDDLARLSHLLLSS